MQQLQSYISHNSLQALRFLPLWEKLSPRTPMGAHRKATASPYLNTDKGIWEREMDALERMLPLVGDQENYTLYVKGMEDLLPMLTAWKHGVEPNRIDWFHLQQFLQKGWRVLHMPKWEFLWEHFPINTKEKWQHLLSILASTSNVGGARNGHFHFEDLFPDIFQPLLETLKQIEIERNKQQSARRARVEQELGFEIGRKIPFYIARKDSYKIDRLIEHPAFIKVKETPFDIAFTWVEDEGERLYEHKKAEVEARWQEAEGRANSMLANRFLPYREDLLEWVDAFGRLDYLYAKACFSKTYNGTRPIWNEQTEQIELIGAIHPWLQQQWAQANNDFTPVDIHLNLSEVAVIVGPNMGGKSVAIKTLGLCTLMAQLGLLVPAKSFRFAPVQGIHYIGGEHENLESGLSSFGGEVKQLVHLLEQEAQRTYLVLCDEVGRGTNPEEGEALAIAMVEELGKRNWYSCFISHYAAVVNLPRISIYQIVGLRDIGVDKGATSKWDRSADKDATSCCFVDTGASVHGAGSLSHLDHRLEKVTRGEIPHIAIQIASWMGMPTSIVNRATEILEKKKKGERLHE